ncbi:MAG: (2Fe-2S)-binding protein [Filifactoraceae bacterium]
MSDEKIICLCKKISEETIIDAIKNGATTIEAVKEATGATGGACRGARCKNKVEELINEYK